MAYITSFVYCENIQNEMTKNGSRTQIVNPLQVLSPISLPGNYSFAISCSIAGFNPQEEIKVRIVFTAPDGSTVDDTGDIEFKAPSIMDSSRKFKGLQLNLDFRNVVFQCAGIYSTKIQIDGETVGEYKIAVETGD